MNGRQFNGLIFDFFGVLTSNMVEVIECFEDREKLPRGTFLRAWADPRGQDLFARLELGEITQTDWNVGYGALMGVVPDDLMSRYLYDAFPAHEMLRLARQARGAGVKTAVVSNSLGRTPYDPYGALICPGRSMPWCCRLSTGSANLIERSSSRCSTSLA